MSRIISFCGLLALVALVAGLFTGASAEPPISAAEETIRRAIEGDLRPGEEVGGLLGDVVDVIQKRGSILDNSSLDLDREENAGGAARPTVSQRAYAAEQLLKASRLLENLGPLDRDRAALVNRMRAEAGKLISE